MGGGEGRGERGEERRKREGKNEMLEGGRCEREDSLEFIKDVLFIPQEFGFGRSLFGRFSRHSRVQHEQAPQVPSGVEIWGVTTEDKGRKQSVSGAPDSRRSKDEKRERRK